MAQLLERFIQKETGFCFIDTHAGAGMYDLRSLASEKTGEYQQGIALLLQQREKSPKSCANYLSIIDQFQDSKKLRYYPGSPMIAAHFLREQDCAILNEKHPAVFEQLKQQFKRDRHVAVHERDAYEFLPAIVPPKNYGRGLVLIDPPFEQKSEIADLTAALTKALKKFAHGTYLIWLPITDKRSRLIIPDNLRSILPVDKHLFVEFTVADDAFEQTGLLGCGLIVVNPPWQFEQELKQILPALWKILSPNGQGNWRIFK